MKSFHDLLFNRRSIRKYTDEEIAADDVKTILQAALVSPSSKGKMPWQFVAVDDKATLEQLSKCKEFGARPIAGCALAVVVLPDYKVRLKYAFHRQPMRQRIKCLLRLALGEKIFFRMFVKR